LSIDADEDEDAPEGTMKTERCRGTSLTTMHRGDVEMLLRGTRI